MFRFAITLAGALTLASTPLHAQHDASPVAAEEAADPGSFPTPAGHYDASVV